MPESNVQSVAGRRPGVRALQAALAAGETTAEEVAAERLELLAREQPRLNAFIEVRADAALAEARASDRRRRAGENLGLLDGVPVAMKDMFSAPGRSPTYGAPPSGGPADGPHATVAERISAAGAVNLGFLNMAPFALGATGHNPAYGDCRNPWNVERISGGSSSGAGVSVAAGVVEAAVGSDTGGSIRIPAACCGMVGLRPTSGRISRHGAMPLAPSFDVVGPIATCVEDVVLLFSALCGPDVNDPDTLSPPDWRPLAPGADVAVAKEIIYPEDEIAAGAEPEVAEAIAQAVRILQAAGLKCARAALPDIGEVHALADLVQSAEAATIHSARLQAQPEAYAPHIRRRIEPGGEVLATRYLDAVAQRWPRRDQFVRDVLSGGRILVVPTLSRGAPTVAETDPEAVGGAAVAELTRWTRWISYLDLPAVSLPCGFDRDGMPIGLQLVAAPYREAQLLELAGVYERLTQWPNIPGNRA